MYRPVAVVSSCAVGYHHNMVSAHDLIDWFTHVDTHLTAFANAHPQGVYGLLFAMIFVETGLVIWPFVPGDSLLFAVGSLAALDNSPIHLSVAIGLMCLAANLGDLVNYTMGRAVGPRIFSSDKLFLLSKKHLLEAQAFSEKHGRKTIILARYVPIIRTFAPFVAGIGQMRFSRFIGFSIAGGVLWVVSGTVCGYEFGQIPWVKKHFEVVAIAIVIISLIPMLVHTIQARKKARSVSVSAAV
jgi:membrane-associated protein